MLLSTLLGVLLLAPPAATAPADAAVTAEQAESLGRKLETIQNGGGGQAARGKARQPVVVTEGELNSYVNLTLRARLPPSVHDVRLKLDRDRLTGNAFVDFDQVKQGLELSPFNPLSLLTGRVPAEFSGRFPNDNGFGTLEIEEVRLGSLPIPLTVLEQAVARSTRNDERPEGVDIHAPFRLPYGIKRVRLQPGRAVLEY